VSHVPTNRSGRIGEPNSRPDESLDLLFTGLQAALGSASPSRAPSLTPHLPWGLPPPPPPPGAAAAPLAAEDIVTHSSAAEGWMPTQESNCALVALHLRATARPCMISAASGPTCVVAGKGGGSVWVWVWGELSE
jgi:hypothetical protein